MSLKGGAWIVYSFENCCYLSKVLYIGTFSKKTEVVSPWLEVGDQPRENSIVLII